MWNVLEERILDNRMELTLREVLEIAKKEFHDSIVNLMKTKRLLSKLEDRIIEVKAAHLDQMAIREELLYPGGSTMFKELVSRAFTTPFINPLSVCFLLF